jgi:hypothetical protein
MGFDAGSVEEYAARADAAVDELTEVERRMKRLGLPTSPVALRALETAEQDKMAVLLGAASAATPPNSALPPALRASLVPNPETQVLMDLRRIIAKQQAATDLMVADLKLLADKAEEGSVRGKRESVKTWALIALAAGACIVPVVLRLVH